MIDVGPSNANTSLPLALALLFLLLPVSISSSFRIIVTKQCLLDLICFINSFMSLLNSDL